MELSNTAMAKDAEESCHRTAFNCIHFMAFKRTIKRSQTENQVQSKHEGGVSSSICDLLFKFWKLLPGVWHPSHPDAAHKEHQSW